MLTRPPEATDAPGLDDATFDRVARLARTEAGLALSAEKRNMIASRVSKRLRATGQRDLGMYLDLVESADGASERRNLVNALTTNVSHFFRERHHFDLLRKDVLPALAQRARAGGRVRFWSAGCSTGQEPYSIAITIRETLGDVPAGAVRILATDIDDAVLEQARRGIYTDAQLNGVDPCWLERHFQPLPTAGNFEVRQPLRDLITFRRLNLIEPWPVRGPFDVIFCRNVVIYFDAETQAGLWPRFRDLLAPGGILLLGHSERLTPDIAASFTSAGITAYRRTAGAEPGTSQPKPRRDGS